MRRAAPSGSAVPALDRLARHACTIMGAGGACVVSFARTTDDAIVAAAGQRLPTHLIGSLLSAGSRPPGFNLARGVEAVAPVVVGGSVRGALWVGGLDADANMRPLGTLAELVEAAFEHHGGRDATGWNPVPERQRGREETARDPMPEIETLIATQGRRDGATAEHSRHVAGLARRVGQRLGLAEADLIEVERGALLHDVGKLRVSHRILAKPGRLTEAEWWVMRRHPLWGAEIVAGIPGLEPVAAIVALHHERVDGNGYPYGLPGHRIPVASRVIAACDAYGAISSDRSYRPARAPEQARRELAAGSGTQFDPDVVAALTDELVHGGAPAPSAAALQYA